jgi:hypothetical protein
LFPEVPPSFPGTGLLEVASGFASPSAKIMLSIVELVFYVYILFFGYLCCMYNLLKQIV